MASAGQKILCPVVIVIKKLNAPPGVQVCHGSQTGVLAGVRKSPIAVVFEKGKPLISERCDYKVRKSVVVVIGKINSHACKRVAIGIDSRLGDQAYFIERSISLVLVQKFRDRIIRDKNVDPSIAVVVGNRDTQSFAWFCEIALLRDFCEMPVTIVVIYQGRNWPKLIGMAIRPITRLVFSTPDVFEVPLQVARDHQIQQAVAIEVHPCSAGGPSSTGDTGVGRYIGERTVAVVVIKLVAAIRRHVEILIAVVVIISDGNSHTVTCSLHTRLFGDVLERAVLLLMVEPVPVPGICFLRNCALGRWIGNGRAVDQKQIKTSIIVEVKKGHTSAHRLNQVFFRGMRRKMLKS